MGETVPNGKLKGEARWERTKMTLQGGEVGEVRRQEHEAIRKTGKNLVEVNSKERSGRKERNQDNRKVEEEKGKRTTKNH